MYNLQGDVIGLIDSAGTKVVEYKYDAWGKPLSKTGSMAATLGTLQPFRYRHYAFDEETGMYYLRSRYYSSLYCLFVSADSVRKLTISSLPLVSTNLYCYCSNNPVGRRDEDGDFWMRALVGVAVQYASDVLTNILNGETGSEIFTHVSSKGTYIAAAVTVVIPGMNGFEILLSNIIEAGIDVVEKAIEGQEVDWCDFANDVMMGMANDFVLGVVFDPLAAYVSTKVSGIPLNYSAYAGKQYKKNPNLTMSRIKKRMWRDHWIQRKILVPVSEFSVGFARESVEVVLEQSIK